VLVCTTIIETGLDIPNVNTIIVEESDRFGLSQLYQLRGRVGRSDRLAYAYFTYNRGKEINETAQKRLRAIRDFAEFGSGFKIALRDLEIRGAGNVIGAEQHGHMDIVGYDMYCKLLEEAVCELKGETLSPEIQTVISLEVDAYLSKKYIVGENFRMEAYKKISQISSEQDYFDVYDELEDRYGPLPKTAENLMDVALIRSIARGLGIEEIKKKQDGIVFMFSENSSLKPEYVLKLISQNKNIKFSPSVKPYLTLKIKDGKILQNVKNLLQQYKQLQNE